MPVVTVLSNGNLVELLLTVGSGCLPLINQLRGKVAGEDSCSMAYPPHLWTINGQYLGEGLHVETALSSGGHLESGHVVV